MIKPVLTTFYNQFRGL